MARFKILYVITQGEWGGAQRYVFDLATGLSDQFEITVAVGEQKERTNLQDRLQATGYRIKVIQLKHLVRKISPIHDILAVFELAKLYKTLKPDIVHLNSSKASILGSLASSFLVPRSSFLVYTVHGWVFNEPLNKIKKMLYSWLEKLTSHWKNKIIVLSDFDYQTGQSAGIPTDKLVKIQLGIETPQFLDKNEACNSLMRISDFRFQISDFIIGTIANLYKTKGLNILIESIKILATDHRSPITDHRLLMVIIGEGPERKNLENLIKKHRLGKIVHLVGAIDNAAQYLLAFDLFVLPSRKEGMPYTLLEAVAAGLPIVATDVGGVKELIVDAIAPNNQKILAEKIIQTIKNPIYRQKNIPQLGEMLQKTKTTYLSCLLPKS